MNLVDLLIIVAVVGAVLHGLYLGAAIQVTSFLGLWVGLGLGAALAPSVAGLAHDPGMKMVLAVVTVFTVPALLGGLGRAIGVRLWRAVTRLHLRPVDSALGAVVAGVATLVVAWLVGSMLANAPAPALREGVQRSKVLRTLDKALPPAPQVFARIDRLLDPLGFPKVFDGLEPTPAAPVALPPDPVVRAAAEKSQASVLRIVTEGCGEIHTGSGFVVEPGLVMTNAHVVAGGDRIVVQDRSGSHPATTVQFDPKLDVAVLSVRVDLAGPPLALAPTTAGRGTQGAVLGYPGGGPLRVVPGAVLSEHRAVGRDIYGRSLATREVYELQAVVRPGNSGGPMVRADGVVVGVVFARSSYKDDVGFALTSAEVRPALDAGRRRAAVDTGPCAAA
jgi:S1-C subfamily serine protease